MRRLTDQPNTAPQSAAYPDGHIRDDSGVITGTSINEATNGDTQAWRFNMLRRAGITPNGLADNETNGYQIGEALDFLYLKNQVAYLGGFETTSSTNIQVGTTSDVVSNSVFDEREGFVAFINQLQATNTVQRYNMSTGALSAFTTLTNQANDLAIDETHVYILVVSLGVRAFNKTTGLPDTSRDIDITSAQFNAIDVDDTSLFIYNMTANEVQRYNKTTGAQMTGLTGQMNVNAMSVYRGSVFVTRTGSTNLDVITLSGTTRSIDLSSVLGNPVDFSIYAGKVYVLMNDTATNNVCAVDLQTGAITFIDTFQVDTDSRLIHVSGNRMFITQAQAATNDITVHNQELFL